MSQALDHTHQFRRLYCTKCGHPIDVPVYCKNRFCRYCTRARSAKIRSRLSQYIEAAAFEKGFALSMLSLTIPNVADAGAGARECVASFRRLRHRSRWKMLVKGGAFVIETTWSSESWHVHIHAIIEAKYFPFEELLALWKECSPGQGVYISRKSKSVALAYLTKYLTKNDVPEERVDELNDSLRDFRLFQPFGTWYGNLPPAPPRAYPCPKCGNIVWMPEIIMQLLAKGCRVRGWHKLHSPPVV